jgi:hypothetical protein
MIVLRAGRLPEAAPAAIRDAALCPPVSPWMSDVFK